MTPKLLLTRQPQLTCLLVAMTIACACAQSSAEPKIPNIPKYNTKYYVLYTDLDKDMAREAVVRITAMAHEYYTRTRSFAGRISTRFPLYLYKDSASYRQHPGVIPGSAGIYNGRTLVATAPRSGRSWRVVQHEGFHQFAHKMIEGRLPVWLNEGLAEYFGNGLWTGDSMTVGLISPSDLARVKAMIKNNSLMSLDKMLAMSHQTWNSGLSSRNYLQAWSMVHFLVHGDNGKYQKALSGYIRDLSKSRSVSQAFRNRFGGNTKAFQASYVRWWNSLDDDPTAGLYQRAQVLTLTSYLARAHYAGKKFATMQEFVTASGDGTFTKIMALIARRKPTIWLPDSLLARAIPGASELSAWTILADDRRAARLQFTCSDGTRLIGSFTTGSKLTVKVTAVKKAEKPAEPAVSGSISNIQQGMSNFQVTATSTTSRLRRDQADSGVRR